MSSQTVHVPKGREEGDFSFFEALSFESKEPAVQISEALRLSAFPTPPTHNKPAMSSQNTLHRSTTASNTPTSINKTKAVPKMGTPSRAQTQCLELCHKTTALIDRVSIRILEYLTTGNKVNHEFETLAHDFIDICQILFSIEAGLTEYNRTGQKFPAEMITELDKKFRVTQADFNILEQMTAKMIGSNGRVKRGWGKLFGDTDISKMTAALGRTRESLRMSALVFQWSLGNEKVEREMGIGYTGLAAALDRMDHKAGNGRAKSAPSNTPTPSPPPVQAPLPQIPVPSPLKESFQSELLAAAPISSNGSHQYQSANTLMDLHAHNSFQHHQQTHQQPPPPWSDRSSSIPDGVLGRAPQSPNLEQLLSADYRHTNGSNGLPTVYSSGIGERYLSGTTESYDRHSILDDARSMTTKTESEIHLEELSNLDITPGKVVHHTVDPSSMPRTQARNAVDGDSANMKAALVSAIRNKNHKMVEQILHRGVSPNTGANMHALKEAVLAHDEESVRLLLTFGADANNPDRDGVTPLFAAVEKSFAGGATILLKYGADPNLVAGPDLETPLAFAVMANNVGFSHLLLSYNGDANLLTAEGQTLLIAAIQKKTPKKFIDLLLEYGSNPNAKSRKGETALFAALTIGRADITASLLEHGADPNLPGPKHMLWPSIHYSPCLQVLLTHGADHKKAPGIMELAVSTNNMESVRILLKAGVNPNVKKDGTYTPLCTSIRDDRPDLLKLLLANGADPNVMASEYPAFKCVTHNRVHFLPALIAAGADLNKPKGILETAVAFKNMEALTWLLDQGVNPNDKTPKGASPLTTAIRDDRLDMVDLLLLRGADPHIRGQDWPICMAVRNPPILKRILSVISEPQAFKGVLEMAVHANQLESVKLLLAAGVSVEDKNGGVFSPLTTALRENRRDIVRYLIATAGADVNAPGEHLPIVKALRRFHGEDTEMLELLIENGADANKLYRGWNAIMQGVENGDIDTLRLLARGGVDLEVRDEMGRTVEEMAASRQWQEAVGVLREAGKRK